MYVLPSPITPSGIGSTVQLVHADHLRFLPKPFNTAFFESSLTTNVISLGNIQRHGGWYDIDSTKSSRFLIKSSVRGRLLDSVSPALNNLLSTTFPTTAPHSHHFHLLALLKSQSIPPPYPIPTFPPLPTVPSTLPLPTPLPPLPTHPFPLTLLPQSSPHHPTTVNNAPVLP